MIGNRRPRLSVVAGALAAVALGVLFCLRPADPAVADPATEARLEADIAAQAVASDIALQHLAAAIEHAIDAGRSAAAATAAGDDAPGPQLVTAAERLEAASAALNDARTALEQLAGLLAARSGATAPRLAITSDDLTGVAAQLRGSASDADAFAGMRHATEDVLVRLQEALSAADARDATAARTAAVAGLARLDTVRPWEARLDTLSAWIDTADALLRSLRDLAIAQLAHDEAGEQAARQAYAVAAAPAPMADRARAIALSEGAAAVTSSALAAAARLAEEVDATIALLAPLVHA